MRKASVAEYADVAVPLAAAFYDDPVNRWYLPHDGSRIRRSRILFRNLPRVAGREVWSDDERRGGAIWAPPGTWEMGPLEMLRLAPTAIRVWRARLLQPRFWKATAFLDRLHPEEPHWYLEFLGTDPAHQGRGVGGALMEPVLERCDREGMAAWAWSSNRRNLGFYHRHGFEVLDELRLFPGGPEVFPIRRAPRTP